MSVDKVEAFNQILMENPDDSFARYGLAMEYRQRGQIDLALEQFDEIEKRNPDYTAAHQMAAQTLIAAGRIEEAQRQLLTGIASARRTRNQHALAEMEAMLSDIEDQNR